MRYIAIILLAIAQSSIAADLTPCDKAYKQYEYQAGNSSAGASAKNVNGQCVLERWPASLGAQPTQAQVDALVDAYDARMATKQAAADALYSTISTRLTLSPAITTKAQLQSRITEVWDALDDKEQQVWAAIESGGLNATRAGQLKQLAQARNKILRLLAEDGIQ
jgi:hypothetical protein